MSATYLGDFTDQQTVHFIWDTNDSAGASITRATDGEVRVYKDNGITQTTTGVTDTEDFDGLTGIHACTIATTDAFYVTGSNYTVVLSAATIDGQTVNATLAHFSIENRDGSAGSVWDRVLTGASHNLADSAGRRLRVLEENGSYQGFIWVDTVNGTAGTTDFENGTDHNPVSGMADANTLAASIGLSMFRIAAGSTITLTATQANQFFWGENWTLALGGQSIDGSKFMGASVTGIATNTSGTQFFDTCLMGAVTLPSDTHVLQSGLTGTHTFGEAGNYFYDRCHSGLNGGSTPIIDFGSALDASDVNFTHWSGDLEIQNMGAGTGNYDMHLEGQGGLVINANCSVTSNVERRGHFEIVDNAGGAVTINNEANLATLGDTAHGGTSATFTAERIIVASTTAGQPAVNLTGNTSGDGVLVTGGATGDGLNLLGGASGGVGVRMTAGASSNGQGLKISGDGTQSGISVDGGSTGEGITVSAGGSGAAGMSVLGFAGNPGVKVTGGTTGQGVDIAGGSTSGSALRIIAAGTNDHAVELQGIGTGAGAMITAGLTGSGVDIVGGGTSGDAVRLQVTDAGNPPNQLSPGVPFGTVTSAGSATVFNTSLTEPVDDFYNDAVIVFLGGNLEGSQGQIVDHDGTGTVGELTIKTGDLTAAPDNGSPFMVIGRATA